ncbi:MAG TPA: MFS transporter [Gaiellales bacterium]|jgi:fucose permease|nr:MFS transporter [Gaiellales bacterium]
MRAADSIDVSAAADLRRATLAVYAVFFGAGFAFASWASRIPQVRDGLHLSPASLGLLLLSIAGGSVLALPLSGIVVARLGAGRTVAVMAVLTAAGLAIAAIGFRIGVAPVVAGLFLLGAGNGTWDVAMNVEGAFVEQRLRRSIMPRFHAGFSVGTVSGALLGAAMVAAGVSVTVHLLIVAALIGLAVPWAARGFLTVGAAGRHDEEKPGHHPLAAWKEPRTLLLGLLVFCMAFIEGTGNDWLGVAMIDGYDASPAVASLTLGIFLGAMTTGRWFGPALLDRFGRVASVRASGILACAGLLLVVFVGSLPLAMAGAVLWGLGSALGFPVGMSAAADDRQRAAGRLSVVTSIGYMAFLAGPPFVGLLGNHVGTLDSLLAVAGLASIGVLVSGVLAPRPAGSLDAAPSA